ncbi:MAG TPA: hypothetical protein VLM85_13245 [Polyangiaceae bacterium]|nr:hypothetical protein [Polyangiaceae bacterium]
MDVTQSVGTAWQRARQQLFQPFQIGTWFAFGVIFFLQSLGEGGFGYYRAPNFSSSSRGRAGAPPPNLRELLDEARHWAADNTGALVAIVAAGLVLGLVLALVVLWLGARGQMMGIRAVASGRPAIGEHWRETAKPAGSLFRFKLVLSAISLVLWGPLAVLLVYRFVDLVDSGVTDVDSLILAVVPFIVVGVLLGSVFFVIQALLRNFVAPLMLRFDETCTASWRRFFGAARGNWGAIFLFFVIRAGLGIAVGIVTFVLVMCTCCIGALPVLNQTLLAPWFVFERAYGLYAIESLGPEYQMMQPIVPPGPPVPPGGFYPPPAAPYPPPPPPTGTWGAS